MLFVGIQIDAQDLWRQETLLPNDTLSLSQKFICSDIAIANQNGDSLAYELLCKEQLIVLKRFNADDTLTISYLTYPKYILPQYQAYDTNNVANYSPEVDDNTTRYTLAEPDIFSTNTIQKYGSLSRGFTIGNNQSLVFNSTLNLQLSGQISNNLFLDASISDRNLPLQPEGNTQVLSEFDQVWLRIYNDRFSLVGGDFFLYNPQGYFGKYAKRLQGVQGSFNYKLDTTLKNPSESRASFAFTRGKFARNEILGLEGNQGPYRLTGEGGNTYVIVLSGTERVYLNGQLLTRGESNDYTINYNTAELIFTPKQQITKDSRIVVEFQYSNQNYSRSLFETANNFKVGKWDTWLNLYSEQDAKNQPILIDLEDSDRAALIAAPSSSSVVWLSGIDNVGYSENEIRYQMIDSLGYDSVLVVSTNPQVAIYRARFSEVGTNQGNYIIKEYQSNGKVFEWVAPVAGVPQGNYEPIVPLTTPNTQQLLTGGFGYKDSSSHYTFEGAFSHFQGNTFSSKQGQLGFGLFFDGAKAFTFSNQQKLTVGVFTEFKQHEFNAIERYRAVEFNRDWNYVSDNSRNQLLGKYSLAWSSKAHKLSYTLNQFMDGNQFMGFNHELNTRINTKHFKFDSKDRLLQSSGLDSSLFVRHQSTTTLPLVKNWELFYQDELEYNQRYNGLGLDQQASYFFYDYKGGVRYKSLPKLSTEIYYQGRTDKGIGTSELINTALANNAGIAMEYTPNNKHRLSFNVRYRNLNVYIDSLVSKAAENTVVGNIQYNLRLFKGGLQSTTFYEVNSGLELQQEFIFVEVAAGQGNFKWVDANGDGIKDLSEFVEALNPDEAIYIKVWIPSNSYQTVYGNRFTQSLLIRPKRIWKPSGGAGKFFIKFWNQTQFASALKLDNPNDYIFLDPFATKLTEEALTQDMSFNNKFHYNTLSSLFSGSYEYNYGQRNNLLAGGRESSKNWRHTVETRINIQSEYLLKLSATREQQGRYQSYIGAQDYLINQGSGTLGFIYQLSTAFQWETSGTFKEKQNTYQGDQYAAIWELATSVIWQAFKKGQLFAELKYLNIRYSGEQGTTLSYVMLESLQPGNNLTWKVNAQFKIGNNLQFNIGYNGRASENVKAVHTGNAELRIFF